MLDINNSIRTETRKYGSTNATIFYFYCSECKINEIKCEKKYLKKHSGKCIFCVHKGIPYLSSYKHLKDGVIRTNNRRKKQKTFDLTFEEFLQFVEIKNCHYCNDHITWVKHTGNGSHRYNLDRKNSDLGYFKDNLVVCCKQCNIMKNAYFTYEEFKAVIQLLKNMRSGQIHKGDTNA